MRESRFELKFPDSKVGALKQSLNTTPDKMREFDSILQIMV